jgi:hypothetical protein
MNALSTSVGRLQTAVKSQTVSNHLLPQERFGHARQMAAAIIARYGQGTALWQPMSPVLREMGKWETNITHQHRHHHTSYTPIRSRLNLVLIQNNHHQQEAGTTISQSTQPASVFTWQPKHSGRREQQTAMLVERVQRHEKTQRTEVQHLTKRLNEQHQPLDMLTKQPKQKMRQTVEEAHEERKRQFSSNISPSTSGKAVPRILRQAKPTPEPDVQPTHKKPTMMDTTPFGVSRMEMGANDKGITAVDTNLLADQVMQKLESRLQAHRERTGRI